MTKYDRPLPARSLGMSAVTGLIVAALLLGGWEYYWRNVVGVPASYYRNSEGLWAIERRRIDNGEGQKTVLAGSSRTLFNTQLDVWEREAGERPIQLALEGTSPVGVIESLADDPDFTGTLIVGVAPDLFFSGFEYRRRALRRYEDETPTQWIGQRISMLFEPYFAFYHYDFALFTVLKRQPLPKRTDTAMLMGVPMMADVRQLQYGERDRASHMWSRVVTDHAYQALAKTIWMESGFGSLDDKDEAWWERWRGGRTGQLERAIAATKKLKDRGIEVVFVHHPVDGMYALESPLFIPRADTWDVLIEETGALGIHWEDHEELQGFWLPEWSHMPLEEARPYTRALYHVIQRERERHNSTGED